MEPIVDQYEVSKVGNKTIRMELWIMSAEWWVYRKAYRLGWLSCNSLKPWLGPYSLYRDLSCRPSSTLSLSHTPQIAFIQLNFTTKLLASIFVVYRLSSPAVCGKIEWKNYDEPHPPLQPFLQEYPQQSARLVLVADFCLIYNALHTFLTPNLVNVRCQPLDLITDIKIYIKLCYRNLENILSKVHQTLDKLWA